MACRSVRVAAERAMRRATSEGWTYRRECEFVQRLRDCALRARTAGATVRLVRLADYIVDNYI